MKKILITGASRGIGLELTKQLSTIGHHVYATCRQPNRVNQLNSIKNVSPENIQILKMDVEDETSIEECFRHLESKNEKIDILFNNAGIIDWNDLHDISATSAEKIYKVNLVGSLLVTKYALSILQKSSSSTIINLSSRLGSISLRGETQLGGAIAYQCSKAALNMLTKQSSIDLKSKNIKVISQSPGWVKTEMGGENAKYEVPESVSKIISTLQNLDKIETGSFIGEDGIEIPW